MLQIDFRLQFCNVIVHARTSVCELNARECGIKAGFIQNGGLIIS